MARTPANMQRLIDQRDQLLREIEALRNKVAGVEMAIALIGGDAPARSTGQRSGKGVKTLLLDMLREAGTTGLNANSAVEIANRKGITLNPGSASSTLSRFKSENVVILGDDNRYRLPEFAPEQQPHNVRPLWGNAQ